METDKEKLKISFLSEFNLLLTLIQSGRRTKAEETLLSLKKKLPFLPPEFSERQSQLIEKIVPLNTFPQKFYLSPRIEPSISEHSLINQLKPEELPGVSFVAACMNRQQNLLKVLPSWLATSADEIIIVDWSSRDEVWPMVEHFGDSRLKVIRIDHEPRWILTHALNVGLRAARHRVIFKLDADIKVSPDFIEKNMINPGEFIRGFWKQAVDAGEDDQKYVNGTFGAFNKDLRSIGYYDERIVTYGWDDSDIYIRLNMNLGLAGRLLDQTTVRHLEQEESQRTENQDVDRHMVFNVFGPTEIEATKNKFYTLMCGAWGSYSLAQQYQLACTDGLLQRGYRISSQLPVEQSIRNLSEVLTVRQFAHGVAKIPTIGMDSPLGLELARLLRDAHSRGKSFQLLTALQTRSSVHFIRLPQSSLLPALIKTLKLLFSCQKSFSNIYFIIEMDVPLEGPTVNLMDLHNVFQASSALIESLSNAIKPQLCNSMDSIEEIFLKDIRESRSITLSLQTICEEIISNANIFTELLGDNFANNNHYQVNSHLVTSLYDEKNIIRLIEYLCCVILNLKVFERIIIAYEYSDGLLQDIICLLSDHLNISIGRLSITPFKKRPTFEELFSLKSLLKDGSILTVANADIVFDKSFNKINHDLLKSHMIILSRWDVNDSGHSASLIKLINGSPNTFSADAWIVSTPFEPDFFLDYPIGTMHCDSFINNQLSISKKYKALNPCLDVHIFHLHDERFNSSEEKQVRDAEEIKINYQIERSRNGDKDPVKGVGWTTISGSTLISPLLRFQTWRPKSFVFNLATHEISFGHLLFLHLIAPIINKTTDTVLVLLLKTTDAQGPIGRLLCLYQTYFSLDSVVFSIDDQEFNADLAANLKVFTRVASFAGMVNLIEDYEVFEAHVHHTLIEWPKSDDLAMIRGELSGGLGFTQVVQLLKRMQTHAKKHLESFNEFCHSLPTYTPEHNLVAPFLAELGQSSHLSQTYPHSPRVSLVTSLFQGRKLLPGYLDNALAAARMAQGEVIIIDANPDATDEQIIREYLANHPEATDIIHYHHLDHDPGLYNCWRLAIEKARAPLISNANLDDKRDPWHTALLVDLLERHPEYAGACGSISCIFTEPESDWYRLLDNQIWFYGEGNREIGFDDLYRTDDNDLIVSRNIMHCMPVWRKSLHKKYGYFDEELYGTSADWAFWLKCAKAGERFVFEKSAFGRYYLNPDSHNRRNDQEGKKELLIINDFFGIQQAGIFKQ